MPPISLLPLLFFILFSSIAPVTSETTFTFSGNITCNIPNRPFSYMIQIMEHDLTSPDDVLSEDILFTSYYPRAEYKITGKDYHDGPWNNFYEIYVLANHDCFGVNLFFHMSLRIPIGEFKIVDGQHHEMILNIDVTRAGEQYDWNGPNKLLK